MGNPSVKCDLVPDRGEERNGDIEGIQGQFLGLEKLVVMQRKPADQVGAQLRSYLKILVQLKLALLV